MKKLAFTALLTLAVAAPGLGQSYLPGHERILVPLYVPAAIPGAHGSQWKTELTLLNTSSSPFVIEGVDPSGGVVCLCPTLPVPPGVSFPPSLFEYARGLGGTYLHVPKEHVGDVVAQLRVRDVSRPQIAWGAEIPVPHESAARGRVDLLDIPMSTVYRQDLRVYDFSAAAGASARLRVYAVGITNKPPADAPDGLILDLTVPFVMPEGRFGTNDHPSYAYIPNLSSRPELAGRTNVRVSITSTSTASKLWAFASITNNDTQQVTVISPQPSR